MIREVGPAEAPVAYRIFDQGSGFAGYRPEDGYCIRSFGDCLWWPLVYRGSFMPASKFEQLAASGNTSVLRAFAPSIRAGGHMQSDSAAEYFKRVETRQTSSSLDASLLAAQSGSHRTAFVGDIVHVEAGAPLYFVTGPETRLQVCAGSSSPDRKDEDGNFYTPSVSLFDRRRSASLGLSFGIGEIDDFMNMPAIRGAEEIRRRARIESFGAHHELAAPLCARFLAEGIWSLASLEGYAWTSPLRQNVPAVAEAAKPGATKEGLRHADVLEPVFS